MTIPNRDTFADHGGKLRNYHPVEDPTTDLDAAHDNRSRYTSAQASCVMPRAIVSVATDTLTILSRQEAWEAASNPVGPVITSPVAGVFRVTYPVSINVEIEAAPIPLSLMCAHANSRSGNAVYTSLFTANVVDVHVALGGGDIVDVWIY